MNLIFNGLRASYLGEWGVEMNQLKIVTLLLAFISPLCVSESHPIQITIYGDDNYPPYSFVENGKTKGIYYDILEEAFAQMPRYDVELKSIPWKRGLALLQQGKIFALYPPYYRPERQFMDYSIAILEEELVAVCLANEMMSARTEWVEDYVGLTIGINLGYASIKESDQGKLTIVESKGTREGLMRLASGKIDCYVNDKISILWEVNRIKKQLWKEDPEVVVGASLSEEKGYLGFSMMNDQQFPYKKEFVFELNQIMAEMQTTGRIQAIVHSYLYE